jgi:hypothetical protein
MSTESLELLFRIQTQGIDAVDKAAGSIRSVSLETKYGAQSLASFEDALKKAQASGQTYRQAIDEIAKSSRGTRSEIGAIAKELLSLDKQLRASASEAEKLQRALEKSSKDSSKQFESFAASVRNGVSSPLSAAGEAIEKVLLKLGPVGAVAAGAFAGLGIAAKVTFGLAASAGALAKEQNKLAIETGLSIKEVGLFSEAANMTGVNVQGLAMAMRTLSQGLSDNSEEGQKAKRAMSQLGIVFQNSFGGLLPQRQILENIAKALGAIEQPSERAREAIAILGRPGINLLPLLNSHLSDTLTLLEKMGVGFDESGAKSAIRFENALDRLGAKLRSFKMSIGVAIAEAAGFGDPEDVKKQGDARERKRREYLERQSTFNVRTGQYEPVNLTLSGDQLRAGLKQPQAPSVSDLVRTQEIGKRQIIENLVENTPQAQLSKAEKDLSEAQKENDDAGVRSALARIKALKDQAEATKERAAEAKRVEELDKRASESGLDEAGKRRVERQYALKENPHSAASVNRDFDKLDAAVVTQQNKQVSEHLLAAQQALEKERLQASGRARARMDGLENPDGEAGANSGFAAQVQGAQQLFDLTIKQAKQIGTIEDQRKARIDAAKQYAETYGNAEEQRAIKIDEIHKKDDSERLSKARELASIEEREQGKQIERSASKALRNIELNADPAGANTPGAQLRAVNQSYSIRRKLADDLAAFDKQKADALFAQDKDEDHAKRQREIDYANIRAHLQDDYYNAQEERENKIAELRKKGIEESRQLSGEIFDALSTNSLPAFFKNQGKQLAKGIFVNETSGYLKSATQALATAIPGQDDGNGHKTGIGKLLAGTILDKDHGKQPIDRNSDSLDMVNTTLTTFNKTVGAALGLTPGVGGGLGDLGSLGISGIPGLGAGDFQSTIAKSLGIFGSDPNGITGKTGLGAIPGLSNLFQSGSSAGDFLHGAGLVASGQAVPGALTGYVTTPDGGQKLSTGGRVGAGIGAASVAYEGVQGVVSGIHQGGGSGYSSAVASGAGAAAALDPEPISKAILGGVALAATVAKSLFGDPKQNRAKEESDFQLHHQYLAPPSIQRDMDTNGNSLGYDYAGHARSLNSSAFGFGVDPTRFDANYNVLAGKVVDPGTIDYTPPKLSDRTGPANVPSPTIIVQLHALDAKSMMDHAADLTTVVASAIAQGHQGMAVQIQRTANPR